MVRSFPLYHDVDQRNAAIVAASLAGMNPFDIAREHRISTMSVDSVLAAHRRRDRVNGYRGGGQPGAVFKPRDVGKPVDSAPAEREFARRARLGSRELLAKILLLHWRERTLPPGMTERRFYEVAQNVGLRLSYNPNQTAAR